MEIKNIFLTKEEIIKYNNLSDEEVEKVEKQLKTGDIILSIGEDNKQERIVKEYTKSPITHLYSVLEYENKIYVLESNSLNETTRKIPDLFYGFEKDGVRMCRFKEVFRNYNTAMFLRSINKELTEDHKKLMFEFYKLHIKKRFETNLFQLWNSEKKIILFNTKSLQKFFCSEFIAELLQFIGLMKGPENGGRASKFYTPKDFITWQPDDKRYILSEPQQIKP